MSELMSTRRVKGDFRRQLLASVSMLTLLPLAFPSSQAVAQDDRDRPTIWIDFGGEIARMDGTGEPYAPPFIAAYPDSEVFNPVSPSQADKAPLFAFGGEGRITFEPADTDWVLSASILYGRSSANNHVHHQITPTPAAINGFNFYGHNVANIAEFADTRGPQREKHTILDFQAGKDFGLGMLGKHATSDLSFGVRFAQFASRAHVDILARPDLSGNPTKFNHLYFHAYTAEGQSDRSFHGIGPSVAWKASVPVAGSQDDSEIALDWGVDATVLFGRQRASGAHTTMARFHNGKYYHPYTAQLYYHNANLARAKSVTVPGLGGFAAISIKYPGAKVTFGYRGNIFFGAVDGGWDTAQKKNLSFHGPYVALSVGLGD